MQRFSKLLVGFSITGLLLLGGFGCKGTTAAQQQAMKPVKLEMWTTYDDVDALQAQIEKFRASRPYLSVSIRQIRASEVYDRLVEALAEDRGPDILSLDNRSLGKFQSKLASMPPTVQDTTVQVVKGQFSTETIVTTKNLPTVTIDQLDREYVPVVKLDAVRGGRIYGLPMSMDTLAMYYNKDLLDRAGIPEPPKTWEEFQEAVTKLTKFDKATGAIVQAGAALGGARNIPYNDDIMYALFKQSNVPFVDRSNRAVFNRRSADSSNDDETAAMKVLDFYTDFANPTRLSYAWSESMPNALDAFVTGKVAFFFGYQFHNPIIKSRAPQLNYAILPMLQLNPEAQSNVANYSLLMVTAKSKQANGAWNVINYLTHTAATKEYLDASGRLTALRAYINAQRENLTLAPFVSQLLIATSWYRGNNYEAASAAIGDMVTEWFQNPPGEVEPLVFKQTILNRAAAKINQTL